MAAFLDCVGCGKLVTDMRGVSMCPECEDAFDRWEADAHAREQRQREQLDFEGYYDIPGNI